LAGVRVSRALGFAGLVTVSAGARSALAGSCGPQLARARVSKALRFADLVTLGRRAEIGLCGAVRAEVGEGARFQDRQISLVCQIWGARAWLVNGRIVLVAYAMEGLS
jgi:hypothetical protein